VILETVLKARSEREWEKKKNWNSSRTIHKAGYSALAYCVWSHLVVKSWNVCHSDIGNVIVQWKVTKLCTRFWLPGWSSAWLWRRIYPRPSYIKIGSYRAIVKYEGQRPTCRLCDGETHFSNTCPRTRRNRETVVEKPDADKDKEQETDPKDQPTKDTETF
jgi:hypothetical protein